jgi:hypothetical protein
MDNDIQAGTVLAVPAKCAVISWDTSTHLAFQCPFSSFLWEFPVQQEPLKQEASTNRA